MSDRRLTDLGNAEQFVNDHGEEVLYAPRLRRWYAWSGRHWRHDDDGEALRRAQQTVRRMYAAAAGLEDDSERKTLAKHAVKCESESALRAIVSLASTQDDLLIRPDELDADPWLLNVRNGTLDLRTGELRQHHPADRLTHCLPVDYDPMARYERFYNFLRQICNKDGDLMAFLQRAAGYSLTGSIREQVFLICYGKGANGKSTYLETFGTLLGSLAQTARFESFLHKRNDSIPNDIARMRGARFITAIEADAERRLSESQLKLLTGGDTVTARFMRGEFFDFQPTAKIWLACNHRPEIRGTDLAIWRRVRLIPFTVTIPPDEQDPDLKGKLIDELPGILAWGVQGAREWYEDGLGRCKAVDAATGDYQREADILGDFCEARCIFESDATALKAELYEAYTKFCEKNGDKPLSQRRFGIRLRERADNIESVRVSKGKHAWKGVTLDDGVTL